MNEKYHQLSDMMKTEERENIRKILDVLLNYQKLRRDTSPENLVFVPKLTAEALGIVIKDALELGLPMEQCRTMLLMGSDTYINGPYEDYNVLTQALHQFVCEASERGVDKYYCLYILEISQIASSIDSFDRRTNIVGDVVCEAMRRGVNRTKCTSILRLSGFHVTPETFERDALVPFVRDAIAAKIDSNLLVQLIRVTHYDMAKVFELEDKYKSDSEDKKFNAVLLQLETAARKLGKLKHDQTLYDLESSTVRLLLFSISLSLSLFLSFTHQHFISSINKNTHIYQGKLYCISSSSRSCQCCHSHSVSSTTSIQVSSRGRH